MKSCKLKTLSIILSILILICSFNIFAVASDSGRIYLEFSDITDEYITVSVHLSPAKDIESLNFSLNVISDGLTIEDISTKDTDSERYETNFEESEITDKAGFIYYHSLNENKLNFSGFFTSAFSSDKSFHICDIKIITEDNSNIILSLSQQLDFSAFSLSDTETCYYEDDETSTRKTLISRPMGDVDGNGAVTSADARLILRSVVGLEDIEIRDIAYANSDGDASVTSADARLTLRTSVGLENTVFHRFDIFAEENLTCENSSKFTFICTLTGKSFTMNIKSSSHLTDDKACLYSGKCIICGQLVNSETNHSFDESGNCTFCFLNKDAAKETINEINSLIDEINFYFQLAEDTFADKDYKNFISSLCSAATLLSEASGSAENTTGLEFVSDKLHGAYTVLFNSLLKHTDKNGKVLSNDNNCKEFFDALCLSKMLTHRSQAFIS